MAYKQIELPTTWSNDNIQRFVDGARKLLEFYETELRHGQHSEGICSAASYLGLRRAYGAYDVVHFLEMYYNKYEAYKYVRRLFWFGGGSMKVGAETFQVRRIEFLQNVLKAYENGNKTE